MINVPGVVGEQGGVVDPGPGGELVAMMMMIIRDEFFTFLILFIRGTCGQPAGEKKNKWTVLIKTNQKNRVRVREKGDST